MGDWAGPANGLNRVLQKGPDGLPAFAASPEHLLEPTLGGPPAPRQAQGGGGGFRARSIELELELLGHLPPVTVEGAELEH